MNEMSAQDHHQNSGRLSWPKASFASTRRCALTEEVPTSRGPQLTPQIGCETLAVMLPVRHDIRVGAVACRPRRASVWFNRKAQ